MKRKLIFLPVAAALLLSLSACGPSEEKIAEAQEKYAQIVEVHNQAVEAHGKVADNSLDRELAALGGQAKELESYNLNEMKDEEIDGLIEKMDSLIASYEEYREQLSEIRQQEEDAVLIPIQLTLANRTSLSFRELLLFEEGSEESGLDALADMEPFAPGQTLEGLFIQCDVDQTPWILALTDEDGKRYEITLPVAEYGEERVVLGLSFDGEQGILTAEE